MTHFLYKLQAPTSLIFEQFRGLIYISTTVWHQHPLSHPLYVYLRSKYQYSMEIMFLVNVETSS
jgi:hypothetical protein